MMDNTQSQPAMPSKTMEDQTVQLRQRMWPYMVLISCFLSYVAAAGFNFGVAGSITEAQKIKFNITLDQSSWTGSVHTAVFFSTGEFHGLPLLYDYTFSCMYCIEHFRVQSIAIPSKEMVFPSITNIVGLY